MSEGPFEQLKAIIRRLRSEGGCPWDRKQTHKSLRPYLLEEAYEALEAIDQDDFERLKEELGDLLLQIVIHAQIASEENRFDIDQVVERISEKLTRRHPHVFGSVGVSGAEEVLRNWEQIKQNEGKGSVLDGVPKELPALLRAHRIQDKAARVGFDWSSTGAVFTKVEEEFSELKAACRSGDRERVEEELGDILFSLVNLARLLKTNPEDVLRKTIEKFIFRFKYIEQKLKRRGKGPKAATLEEMDKLWDEAKEPE